MQQPPSVHAEGAATHATRVVETRESETDQSTGALQCIFLRERGANGDAQTWIRNEQMKWKGLRCIRATWDGSNDKTGAGADIVFIVVDEDMWHSVHFCCANDEKKCL